MKSITHSGMGYDSFRRTNSHISISGLWKRFIEYADKQQFNRLWWMALGVLGHGTVFTIATLMAITFLGNVFALYIIACCTMVAVVVVNLAALPTKYTIPIFFFSLLIDIAVIIAAILLH